MARRGRDDSRSHDDSQLMVPPPGFKFIPKSDTVCGKAGCFECFDIYCERCESKDRRIVELEMRNNDLVKYVTQLQGRFFGSLKQENVSGQLCMPSNHGAFPSTHPDGSTVGAVPSAHPGFPPAQAHDAFAYVQSPVLYDPSMNVSYVATTSFTPASGPPNVPGGK